MRFDEFPAPGGQRPALMLCGDPHGHFGPVIQAVLRHRPQATVLLGDLTPAEPLHVALAEILPLTEVWFIPGNHDSDRVEYLDRLSVDLIGTPLQHRNLHGRVATVAGFQVAGLGGIFREAVWYPRHDAGAPAVFDSPQAMRSHLGHRQRWRQGVSLRHRTSIFPSEVRALAARRADLLVTHEAPSWHEHGFAAIDTLAQRIHVRWLAHGHHHQDIDYQVTHHRLRKPTGCAVLAYGVAAGRFIALPPSAQRRNP